MFQIAIGSSPHTDTAKAVGDAIAQALSGLGTAPAQAGIVLNHGHNADSTVLNAINDTWPALKLIGCAGGDSLSARRIQLLLLSSSDLIFQLGCTGISDDNAELAAEHSLAEFMPRSQQLALHLQLGDRNDAWQRQFSQAVQRLLPESCRDLTALLPPVDMPPSPQRYYLGQSCLSTPCPQLLALHRHATPDGWHMTRQPGIVRKKRSDTVWIYDTLQGDRRRKPAA